jgi:selenocysteine lyase/cysteine desulfurase
VRPDARRFENWESFVAGKIGLGVAIDYALDWGLDAIYARVRTLAEDLRRRLADLPGVRVRDLGRERCGIVSFTVEGCEPLRVRAWLAQWGVNVHTSPRRYTLLDMDQRGLREVVRASVHYYNSEDEVDRLCAGIAAL